MSTIWFSLWRKSWDTVRFVGTLFVFPWLLVFCILYLFVFTPACTFGETMEMVTAPLLFVLWQDQGHCYQLLLLLYFGDTMETVTAAVLVVLWGHHYQLLSWLCLGKTMELSIRCCSGYHDFNGENAVKTLLMVYRIFIPWSATMKVVVYLWCVVDLIPCYMWGQATFQHKEVISVLYHRVTVYLASHLNEGCVSFFA